MRIPDHQSRSSMLNLLHLAAAVVIAVGLVLRRAVVRRYGRRLLSRGDAELATGGIVSGSVSGFAAESHRSDLRL